MKGRRKITVTVPADLLEKAMQAHGTGVTETVLMGLRLTAASDAYTALRQLRGKVKFSMTWQQLKDDR
jgi:hypothetical protein